jgi:hypothetical protein
MPQKRKRKRPSAKRQIEKSVKQAPGIKEIAFFKKPRGLLVDVSKGKKATEVGYKRLPTNEEKLELHTHPALKKCFGQALPSYDDLKRHMQGKYHSMVKTSVIASMNPKGKVIGYTFIQSPGMTKADIIENMKIFKIFGDVMDNPSVYEITKVLGFKIRFAPMPGYEYKENHERFDKIKPKKKSAKRKKKKKS